MRRIGGERRSVVLIVFFDVFLDLGRILQRERKELEREKILKGHEKKSEMPVDEIFWRAFADFQAAVVVVVVMAV